MDLGRIQVQNLRILIEPIVMDETPNDLGVEVVAAAKTLNAGHIVGLSPQAASVYELGQIVVYDKMVSYPLVAFKQGKEVQFVIVHMHDITAVIN